ncbi:membrane protein [Alkalihalobacillus alcalophilus ATCC 27647 = CGMCC 1.3604]|uniref:Membrane protein n=1 Tax=Alkalihalobacillus alcalophilus ATCC 27647 = CGMCC 1.3604 TaxID=1218173 RepID=A0A094WFV4_ALKAL|nr:phage holin family protein [Alkalihalobacillus alcalophilus]KGA95656.1 membrane protein [Alkalihalobacillus alcalophilus ATCC 27647 = CGMCC 1.3604]MED1564071.1 phage holin family protein [Alkalihalobacillus alcalophilus]THG89506.1 membrane protein [Alkalihalobacillus alcalophilus ATCC 27647 = CGMCC 1.3604]
MRWLIGLLLNAGLLMLLAQVFEGFYISGFMAAIIASLVLSVINMIVKPILLFFTLPITILTLGLFLLVINAVTLLLTAFVMGSYFTIEGFGLAVLAALIISIVQTFVIKPVKNA